MHMHFGRQVINLGLQENLDTRLNKSSTSQKKAAYVPSGNLYVSSKLNDANLPFIMAWWKRRNLIDPPANRKNSDYMFEAAGIIFFLRSHPPSEQFHMTLRFLDI
jgi:hypothetical protein